MYDARVRRLRRIPGWIAVGLSSLLFVATAVFWVRSYRVYDDVGYVWVTWPDEMKRVRRDFGVRTVKGKWVLRLNYNHFNYLYAWEFAPPALGAMAELRMGPDGGWYWHSDPVPTPPARAHVPNVLGFGREFIRQKTKSRDDRYRYVSVPAVVPLVVFGIVPGAKVIGWARRRRRRGKGHCPGCGYDMRATPQRCPECGRSPI